MPCQGERTQTEPPGDILILNFQPPDREKCISVVWACLGCFRTEPPWAPTEAAARRGQTPSWGPLPGPTRRHTRPPGSVPPFPSVLPAQTSPLGTGRLAVWLEGRRG